MNARLLLLSFGIILALTLILYTALTNTYISEKLGYKEEKVLNLEGTWEGTYIIEGVKGCIKVEISKRKEKSYDAIITFYKPLSIRNVYAKAYTQYTDFDYATVTFVNETLDLLFGGKVKGGRIMVLRGNLKDLKFERIEIEKFAKTCEEEQINERSAFEEFSQSIEKEIPPSCAQKIKEYSFLLAETQAQNIKISSSEPCVMFIEGFSKDMISNIKPIYENETYTNYGEFEIQWLNEGAVVRFR